jgi:hypothetical protein
MNWRNIAGFILLAIGVMLWFLTSAFRMLITSDIPVNFTHEESALAQGFFIASGIIVFLATLLAKARGFYLLSFGIFGSITAFNLFMYQYHKVAEYYTTDYARLNNVSIYVAAVLALINLIYLIISVAKGNKVAKEECVQ